MALVCALAVLAAGRVSAAPEARRCRAGVEHSMRRMSRTGMQTIDRCHVRRNRGRPREVCNVLPTSGGNNWARQTARTALVVAGLCAGEDTAVRRNYPPCEGAGCDNVTAVVVAGTRQLVETSAAALADESRLRGRAARCRRAIGAARRRITLAVLARAQRCQARIDRRPDTTEFGAISGDCLVGAGRHGRRGRARIVRACSALPGGAAGSCEPLPECVVAEAVDLGRALARLTYGQPISCGNGVVDLGEECDDGNTVPTDACTDECRDARCGDGVTWAGVEECDDGNDIRTDDCDACHLPVCGDGVQAGGEECDDGNTLPDDGCTSCAIDPVPCGLGGLRATVVYDDPNAASTAAGRMLIAYPASVSLPGSGPATSVRQRVVDVSGTSNPIFLASDTDANGDAQDDTLVIVFGITSPWPVGNFATVTFDCAAGTPVRVPEFACSFNDASDPFATAVDPSALVCAVTVLEPIP